VAIGCSSSDGASPDSALPAVDAAPSPPDAPAGGPTAYRITSLAIVDPPLWQGSGPDCTNLSAYMNGAVGSQISSGAIDALIVFAPLSTAHGSSTPAEIIFGDCDSTGLNCSAEAGNTQTSFTATSLQSGACLNVIAGTLAPDDPPAIMTPAVPCFTATAETATLELAGLRLDLVELSIGAGFSSEAVPSTLQNGLLYGFLTTDEAASITVPGLGLTLDRFLRAGGSCAGGTVDDRDTATSTTADGWYLYLTFTASRVNIDDRR
jgi:hypothetical protein